ASSINKLDCATNTWSAVTPTGETLAARAFPKCAYDPDRDRVIIHGGVGAGSTILTDTLEFDPATNALRTLVVIGGPPPGDDTTFAFAYSPDHRLFLRYTSSGGTPDFWTLAFPTGDDLVAIGRGSLAYAGGALAVNASWAVGRGLVSYAGRALQLIEAAAIGRGALTYTGRSLAVNVAVALGRGALTYAGRAVDVLTAGAVAIGRGALTYIGRAVTIIENQTVTIGRGAISHVGRTVTVLVGGVAAAFGRLLPWLRRRRR
ncbi:MAG TPA: hypothetical protein VF406_10885, partial [Thermodesulfobacteriota bacterium]